MNPFEISNHEKQKEKHAAIQFFRSLLELDVSRTDDVAVVRCRGRIIFGEEADELRRVVLGLLTKPSESS